MGDFQKTALQPNPSFARYDGTRSVTLLLPHQLEGSRFHIPHVMKNPPAYRLVHFGALASAIVSLLAASSANTRGLGGTPILIDSATQNIGGISFGAATGNYFNGTTPMAPGVYKSSTNLGAGTAIAQIIGTGTLTVTSGASSNFASWANDPSKGNIPGEPPTGDFDNDGLTNLIEYALGKNPRVSSQPAGILSGNVITFTKGTDAIANGDVSWFIETSTTLAAGSWTTQVTQAAGNPAATISYTFTPSTPVANFARLKVTQN